MLWRFGAYKGGCAVSGAGTAGAGTALTADRDRLLRKPRGDDEWVPVSHLVVEDE